MGDLDDPEVAGAMRDLEDTEDTEAPTLANLFSKPEIYVDIEVSNPTESGYGGNHVPSEICKVEIYLGKTLFWASEDGFLQPVRRKDDLIMETHKPAEPLARHVLGVGITLTVKFPDNQPILISSVAVIATVFPD
jgi:hypothetical protein